MFNWHTEKISNIEEDSWEKRGMCWRSRFRFTRNTRKFNNHQAGISGQYKQVWTEISRSQSGKIEKDFDAQLAELRRAQDALQKATEARKKLKKKWKPDGR